MDYFINLLTGSLIALSAWREIEGTSVSILSLPSFKQAVLFGLLVFLPIGYYLAIVFPDWSWMYFIDPSKHSIFLTLLCVTLYFPALLLGYLLTALLIRFDRGTLASGPFLVGVLGFLFFLTVPYERIIVLGTYNEFRTGNAPSIFSQPFFLASMAVIGIYYFVPLGLILWKNYKKYGVPFATS